MTTINIKKVNRLSVNSSEALVVKGVNVRAMFMQKVSDGTIYRNIGHFVWLLTSGKRGKDGRFLPATSTIDIKEINLLLAEANIPYELSKAS
tara:strand:+ start:338 stop:613 length:276 start_codon:yes stop_codon:yes gene_type:complete